MSTFTQNLICLYQIAVVGGGLSGLSFAILMARKGYSVILFEKETYPLHRVCGEYISLESLDFITQLGISIDALKIPIIKKIGISSPSGTYLSQSLPLGGFGISRYLLDYSLAKIATKEGVTLLEKTPVNDVIFHNNFFEIDTSNQKYKANICVGAFGKRSNLDVRFNRNFIINPAKSKRNFIGVKYHLKLPFDNDLIELHNFEDGYCGISRVENDITCMCYITTAENLKKYGTIENMEKNVLFKNEFLRKYFTTATFLFAKPVTIAQINFSEKTLVQNHILFCGDSAGLIAPLCGNGMSMAMHAATLLASEVDFYFKNDFNRAILEKNYQSVWRKNFKTRLFVGRWIQYMFGKIFITNIVVGVLKYFPKIVTLIIKNTHGKPF